MLAVLAYCLLFYLGLVMIVWGAAGIRDANLKKIHSNITVLKDGVNHDR